MSNTYSIRILDSNDKQIGELMTASSNDILKFINKGFKVIDKQTGLEITENNASQTIGVSDGLINISR